MNHNEAIMKSVIHQSVQRTIQDLARPSTLVILIAPIFVCFFLSLMIAVLLWDNFFGWSSYLFGFLLQMMGFTPNQNAFIGLLQSLWSYILSGSILILILVLTSAIVLIVLQSVFLTPVLSKWVNERHYPEFLKPRNRVSYWMQFKMVIRPTLKVLLLWLFLWPLLFVPVVNFALGLLTNAYLIRRIYIIDSLGDIASEEEMQKVRDTFRKELRWTSLIAGLSLTLPFSVFIAPVILCFFYLHFGRLALIHLRTHPNIL